MDISADKYKSDINRPDSFSTVLHTVLGFVRWLIWFFTLTEGDQMTAGFYVVGEVRDG